jgi:hypothetical protein
LIQAIYLFFSPCFKKKKVGDQGIEMSKQNVSSSIQGLIEEQSEEDIKAERIKYLWGFVRKQVALMRL